MLSGAAGRKAAFAVEGMMDAPVSFGCGVNSIAMVILLANEGWRGPILFADTGTEWPETYVYLNYFEDEWLAPSELTVIRIGAGYRRGLAKMSLIEYCEYYRVTPFAGARWCTSRWKTEPIERWCIENGWTLADTLLGIATEESHRLPLRERPLVDRGLNRDDCARLIVAEGLQLPRKSGCYICPFQRKSQWRELLEKHPDLYERAARMEEVATERRAIGKGGTANIAAGGDFSLREFAERIEAQPTMLNLAEYYQPCLCRL